MPGRAVAWLGALAVVGVFSLASGTLAGQRSWSGPRTPWGDPDFQGVFTTDDELGVPFERPEEFGNRPVVTEEEFAQRDAQSQRQAAADAEAFVAPRGETGRGGGGTGPPAHWIERGRPSRRSSVVIDPPDGRIPFVDEAARRRAAVAVNARTSGTGPFLGPEDLDLYDRCITRGFPHVIFPTIYNNTTHVVQGPGFLAIGYEMIHDLRVIPIGDRPPLSPTIRHHFGDSHGRWEGDTLVVETDKFTFNAQSRFGVGYLNGLSDQHLRVIERFTRVDAETLRYEVTVADPSTFSRPWTAALSLRRDARQAQIPEYACHEGNYAMFNSLSGARAEERAAPRAR